MNLRVGLVGCGAIGRSLAKAISDGRAGTNILVMICDIDPIKVESLYKEIGDEKLRTTIDHSEVIDAPDIDLIVEAASKNVVKNIAVRSLKKGKNLFLMSIGALADVELYNDIYNNAAEKDLKVYLPSGAICGLDGVKSASVGKITHAEIISTKNPKSLIGAPYLVENGVDISSLNEPKTVYQGSACDAIKGLPNNVNVAVALSLAGIGVYNTRVKIIADPKASRTSHEITVEGDFGKLYTKVQNWVHPENPKTSYLAALAGIRTLKKIVIQFK